MRYQTILASFALLAGLVSALPSAEKYDAGVARRGETKEDECVKCPPDEPPPCNNCTKGCIYIECNDCDKKEDCCKCLGLEKKKPYVYSLLNFCSYLQAPGSSSQTPSNICIRCMLMSAVPLLPHPTWQRYPQHQSQPRPRFPRPFFRRLLRWKNLRLQYPTQSDRVPHFR